MALDFSNIPGKLRTLWDKLATPTGDLGTVQPPVNPPGTPSPVPPARPNTVSAKFKSSTSPQVPLAESGDIYGRSEPVLDSLTSGVRRIATLFGNNSPAGSGAPTYVNEAPSTPTSSLTRPPVHTAPGSLNLPPAAPVYGAAVYVPNPNNRPSRAALTKAATTTSSAQSPVSSAPTVAEPIGSVPQFLGEVVPGSPNLSRLNFGYSPEQVQGTTLQPGQGVATNGDQTVFLRDTPNVVTQSTSTPMPTAAPTTTYGDSTGVYQLAPGQNPPRDWSKASLADVFSARLNNKLRQGESSANLADTQAGVLKSKDFMDSLKLPTELREGGARALLNEVNASKTALLAPTEANLNVAKTEETKAGVTEKLASAYLTTEKGKQVAPDSEAGRKLIASQIKNYDANIKKIETDIKNETDPAKLAFKYEELRQKKAQFIFESSLKAGTSALEAYANLANMDKAGLDKAYNDIVSGSVGLGFATTSGEAPAATKPSAAQVTNARGWLAYPKATTEQKDSARRVLQAAGEK